MPDQGENGTGEFQFDGEFDEARARRLIENLRAENKTLNEGSKEQQAALQKLEREKLFLQVKTQHPFVEEGDFDGLEATQDAYAARAERLASLAGNVTTTEKAPEDVPEADALRTAQQASQGSPATGESTAMSLQDAESKVRKGEMTNHQLLELVDKGLLVDADGSKIGA